MLLLQLMWRWIWINLWHQCLGEETETGRIRELKLASSYLDNLFFLGSTSLTVPALCCHKGCEDGTL